MSSCLSCTAEVTNGLALCEGCRIRCAVYLEFLPVYFANLARWQPGRAGSRPVPGSRIPKGVIPATGDSVSVALDEAGAELDTWARCLSDDRGVVIPAAEGEASVVRVLCWVFAENLTSIATLEWAGEFVRGLERHEARLQALTHKVAPGWYAGACARCDTSTYVVPGLTWVTCGGCGARTYSRDHLDIVLDEAREWVERPMRLAEAIVCLVDTEQSIPRLHKRISKWGERGAKGGIESYRSIDADGDEVGPKKFRLGDVMDRLRANGETRGDRRGDRISQRAS